MEDRLGRVVRGGSFNGLPSMARSAYRMFFQPGFRAEMIGFRVSAGLASEFSGPQSRCGMAGMRRISREAAVGNSQEGHAAAA